MNIQSDLAGIAALGVAIFALACVAGSPLRLAAASTTSTINTLAVWSLALTAVAMIYRFKEAGFP